MNLLKLIDNVYCRSQSDGYYDYDKRNYSTSHVHMMLSVALTQMMDNTESIWFLNTPNSITPYDTISKTESPWIYAEIAMTQLIRQKDISEYRVKRIMESLKKAYSEGGKLEVEYDIDLGHLTTLSVDNLCTWERRWRMHSNGEQYIQGTGIHALDMLYQIVKAK